MIVFDHGLLVARDLVEVKKLRELLVQAEENSVQDIVIRHRDNQSCCRAEPWDVTLAQIAEAVSPARGFASVNLDPYGVLPKEPS